MLEFKGLGYPFQNLTKAIVLSPGGRGRVDIHAPFSEDS